MTDIHIENALTEVLQQMLLRAHLASTHNRPMPPHMIPLHILHCFDYLRMSLMCCGDTALEGQDVNPRGTFGLGTTHVCKDWGILFETANDLAAGIKEELEEAILI